MALIRFIEGPNQGAAVELVGDKVLLGRNLECTIVLNKESVSREHALILRVDGKFYLEDLKSRNKTFVNKKEVTGRIPLKDNDTIKICDYICVFLESSTAPPPKTSSSFKESGEDSAPDQASVSGWVQQLVAGDKEVPAEKLWERYFQRLVGLAHSKLGNFPRRVADEEDVALSAFDSFCAGAVRGKYPQLNDRDNLWRLLVTITARKAYQLNLSNRRQKRGRNAVLDEAALAGGGKHGSAEIGLEQFIAYEPTPAFAAQAAEEYQLLLALLPDDQLRQLAQWKMEGFTNEDIAGKLGCDSRTVERRLLLIRSLWADHD